MIDNCGNCTFANQQADLLVCRRYPPTSADGFPHVGFAEWCGEFDRAEVVPLLTSQCTYQGRAGNRIILSVGIFRSHAYQLMVPDPYWAELEQALGCPIADALGKRCFITETASGVYRFTRLEDGPFVLPVYEREAAD
jgi:hypothetical protein